MRINQLIIRKTHLSAVIILTGMILISCNSENTSHEGLEALQVSKKNPHLMETISSKPVFLNNFTAWDMIVRTSREDTKELVDLCKQNDFNMISTVLLIYTTSNYDTTIYNYTPFEMDSSAIPDLQKINITEGADPEVPGEYDYWDHVDFAIQYCAENEMYICLLPAWGSWVAGGYSGELTGKKSEPIIFNGNNAYQYGQWLGQRYGKYKNIIWMLGGDRSAVYDSQTATYRGKRALDYRNVFRALAEGLADGTNNINKQDGAADFSTTLISYHPRKWAPNSSEWFHNDPWLDFNSIQDTPFDEVISVPHDYEQVPVKPTWLFEGRYEGRVSAWGVRYQSYHTVFSGAFGHTYGCYEIFNYPLDFQKLSDLPALGQMAHLYKVAREIWSDSEFYDRIPAQYLLVGEPGSTFGDGDIVTEQGEEGNVVYTRNSGSDRLTAIAGKSGDWAMVYSANGRNIDMDLSQLAKGEMNAYWFNPRNGKWYGSQGEVEDQIPFQTGISTNNEKYVFDPPGEEGRDNDWVLVLK